MGKPFTYADEPELDRQVQCKARSKQTKNRCKRPAIPGGTVCRFHGGGAPQVAAKAKERLAALVDPAITRLGELLEQRKNDPVALAAAKDILDRAGHKAPAKVEPTPEGGVLISWQDSE